jgi:hypothetical protein
MSFLAANSCNIRRRGTLYIVRYKTSEGPGIFPEPVPYLKGKNVKQQQRLVATLLVITQLQHGLELLGFGFKAMRFVS